MASASARTNDQDLTENNNDDKSPLMSARQSLDSSPDSAPTNKEQPLCLEDIQIYLLDENEKDEGANSQENPQETKQFSSGTEDNGRGPKEENVLRHRRIGVVESNDLVVAARMKARVLRKRFGEGLVSEIPEIFNKKL